ncbi:MAG: sulfoxide reductase heme-binding subunit YedZ [Rhodocyclaceae bacterium]|nr:sulfoxide reductase heme-binding subunit YedZ [Rhodocyclaceae bacterium]
MTASPPPSRLPARHLTLVKTVLFLACLLPATLLVEGWLADTLGANPVEAVAEATGEWTLRLLLLTLAVTPVRRLSGAHWLLRLRRTLGLFTFAYGCLHFTAYVWLDQQFDWHSVAADILERPYIAIGFAALVLMTPLALTSNGFMVRRLGGRRWQSLHRSIYAIAILGVVHMMWQAKDDLLEALIYAAALTLLLGLRGMWRNAERRRQLSTPRIPPGPSGRKVIRIVAK